MTAMWLTVGFLSPVLLLSVFYLHEQGYFPFYIALPGWVPIVFIIGGIAAGAYFGQRGSNDSYSECGTGPFKYEC